MTETLTIKSKSQGLIPARFRGSEVAPLARPADHPATSAFLDYHANIEEECRTQAEKLDQYAVVIATQERRIEMLEEDLRKTRIHRDRFADGYFELKAQLSVLASTAIASTQSVADVAAKAMEAATRELQRAGIFEQDMSTPADGMTSDNVAEIARRFGADARPAEQSLNSK